jgi:hypothetical protein
MYLDSQAVRRNVGTATLHRLGLETWDACIDGTMGAGEGEKATCMQQGVLEDLWKGVKVEWWWLEA